MFNSWTHASRPVAACAALGLGAASALAHNHITVDTASGAPGDRIVIRAGYYPTEGDFTINAGRLLFQGTFASYDIPERFTEPGPYRGWAAGDELLLTSDFYFATGRLAGGDFNYEIVGINRVSGSTSSGSPTIVWGVFDENTGEFLPHAASDGSTRAARSFNVGIGGHEHAQGFAFTGGWVQDVTVVAWDANAKYLDSTPVTFRVDNGDCAVDIDRTGGVTIDDIFIFINLWFAADSRADFDRSGTRDIDDIFIYLNAWFVGCG